MGLHNQKVEVMQVTIPITDLDEVVIGGEHLTRGRLQPPAALIPNLTFPDRKTAEQFREFGGFSPGQKTSEDFQLNQ